MSTDTTATILTLPGWQNSGPDHWQSRWEILYGDQRVQQHDWMTPLRGDWMAQLEEAVLAAPPGPVVLAAHSLGCILTAAWASHSRNAQRVVGALLVAPGDSEREELRAVLKSWHIPLQRLPFRSILLNSLDDPYCSRGRAKQIASAWGSEFVDYGNKGHINAESGLGDWPEGRALLNQLLPVISDTQKENV
ncbi:MAG: alpha/beta fold hydrolase [Pseudomonadota bacterium]